MCVLTGFGLRSQLLFANDGVYVLTGRVYTIIVVCSRPGCRGHSRPMRGVYMLTG